MSENATSALTKWQLIKGKVYGVRMIFYAIGFGSALAGFIFYAIPWNAKKRREDGKKYANILYDAEKAQSVEKKEELI